MSLEAAFHQKMVDIYERAKSECHYNATRFLQMVEEHGGLQAAKQLIASKRLSEGLIKLWEMRRLDISMEALVIQEPWSSLFTAEEVSSARKLLKDLGYPHA
jgi:hypothetical protein